VRFVDGTGTVLKNGGRVMKNVTGYDLVKLLAGSWGTLGVLTEVAFKVLPDTETQANVVIEGLSPHQAVEAMSTALGSPFEVTGAAHLPGGRAADRPAAGGVRGERGLPDRAVERASGAPFGSVRAERTLSRSRGLARGARRGGLCGRRVMSGASRSNRPTRRISRAAQGDAVFDWGGGSDLGLRARGHGSARAPRGLCGHATLVRASEDTRARIAPFQPEAAPIAALSEGLRGSSIPGAS
jgi:glycolate oxidase FAD binding subunit